MRLPENGIWVHGFLKRELTDSEKSDMLLEAPSLTANIVWNPYAFQTQDHKHSWSLELEGLTPKLARMGT